MTESGPIVYIPQEPRFRDRLTGEWKTVNMLSASDFGRPEVLCEPDRQMSILNAAQMVRILSGRIQVFRDTDFLLCGGDPALIATCAIICARRNHGSVMLLKWDKQTTRYYPVPVQI